MIKIWIMIAYMRIKVVNLIKLIEFLLNILTLLNSCKTLVAEMFGNLKSIKKQNSSNSLSPT
jgi:hypothetical protein